MSASPDSFSSTRPNAGAEGEGPFTVKRSRLANLESGKATDDHVLARLRSQRGAQLLDCLAAVLVLVDVLLPEQDRLVEPLLQLALDDFLAHVLRPVLRLLGGYSLLTLAVFGRHVLVGHSQRGGG